MAEHTRDEIRAFARILDAYEAQKKAEAKRTGMLQIIDCVELEALGVTQEIVDEIKRLRDPKIRIAAMAQVDKIRAKAKDAVRFADLHRANGAKAYIEIDTLKKAAAKHAKDKAESARIASEIRKQEKALERAERGAKKQDEEAARLTAEADAAEAAVNDTI